MPTLHRTVDAEDGLYQLVVYLEVILLELLLDHFLQFVAVGEVRVRDLGEDILADVLEYLDVDEEKLRQAAIDDCFEEEELVEELGIAPDANRSAPQVVHQVCQIDLDV